MRKLKWLMVAFIIGSISKLSFAVCASTDIQCFNVRGTQKYRVDSSGNQSVAGNSTVTGNVTVTGNISGSGSSTIAGKTVYTPTLQVNVSTCVAVSPTASYVLLRSTGGVVTFKQVGRNPVDGPAISTATATNGQYLILYSTSTTDNIVITTGTATGVLSPSDATITISGAKPAMSFIYDTIQSCWIAIGKQ